MNSIIKNNFWYTLSALGAQACQGGILLSALYLLPPEHVGLFSLSMSICSCMSLWLSLGLRQIVVLDYYHVLADRRARLLGGIASLYLYSLPFTLTLAVPLCLYFLVTTARLEIASTVFLLVAVVANGAILFFSEGVQQVSSYRAEIGWLATHRMQASALVLLVSLIGVLVLPVNFSVHMLLLAQFCGNCFIACTGLAYLVRNKAIQFLSYNQAKQIARSYLKRGVAFLPSLVSAWVLQISNRWVVAYWGNLHDVAFYSLSDYVYVLFSTCLLLPLGATYVPTVLEEFSRAQNLQAYKQIDTVNIKRMLVYMLFLLVAPCIFYKPAQTIFYWIVPAFYRPCLPLIYIRFIGLVFFLATYFTTCFIQFMRRAQFLIWSLVATACVNTFLACLFAKYYGVVGALIALGIAQLFYFALTIWYNRYLHKLVASRNIHRDTVLCGELYTPSQYSNQQASENHVQL